LKRQMIIRVYPNDRVEVKVEGLTESDRPKPKGAKLCDKITSRLEQDLGVVVQRQYDETDPTLQVEVIGDERLKTDG